MKLKQYAHNTVKALPIVLPLFFVLFFWGYLAPKYEVTLFSKNVVGDGVVQGNKSAPSTFAHNYNERMEYNDQQSVVTFRGIHYDVNVFAFLFSSVSEADFMSYEVSWLGIPIARIAFKDIMKPGQYGRFTISQALDGENVHIVVENPEADFTLKVKIDYVSPAFWAIYWALFFLIVLIISFGLGFALDRFTKLRFPLASLAGIVTVLLAGCFFCKSLPYVDYTCFLLNVLLLFGASIILGALTTPLIGSLVVMGATLLFYITNYFTIIFRGRPVMPADLAAAGTAKEVLGGYVFTPTWQMLLGIAVSVVYAIGLILLWKESQQSTEKGSLRSILLRRSILTTIGALIVVLCLNNPVFKKLDASSWDMTVLKDFHQDGMWLTFIKYTQYSAVKEPIGYTHEVVDGYLKEYQNYAEMKSVAEVEQPTNIIMIMNEAFSDLRIVGLDENIDVMPFIDSLNENTIAGQLNVSVLGGGTCNTEFEALTGNTLAFFGPGAYPYVQSVKHNLFSLASYFADNAYISTAFHANNKQNWNRDNAYPLLGFETFHSIDDYSLSDKDYLHLLPSDMADYRYMERVANENRNFPRFSFIVTMQNHAGYERWEDLEEAEPVRTYGDNLAREVKVYLSLIKASDDAIKQLVETYRDSEDRTMIIFFGDHQPMLSFEAGSSVYTGDIALMDMFKTKFFIWTNYETEPVFDVSLSANFLPWLILERGNFPLPPYIQMLKEVHEKYPVISSIGVVDSEGNRYGSINDLLDDPLIKKYQYVQYANLFDEINPAWFEVN